MTTAEVYPSASIALTDDELSSINGGWIAPLLWGIVGAYLYEKMGGAAGIDSAASSIGSATRGATFTNGAGVDLTIPS